MRGGYREKAGRTCEGWAGVKKGTGSKLIRLPLPLADALLKLKAQHTEMAKVQKALEGVPHQHLDSEFKWKLKFDEAAVEHKQLLERLRFENADLRKALDKTCKKIERLEQAQLKV